MNRIFRSIRNATTGTAVAVSEQCRRAGRATSATHGSGASFTGFALHILAVSVMLACGATAIAAPLGGVVTAGGATIGAVPGTTTITQTTQNAAINWQSFNIGSAEAVRFIQPNSSAVALNRVIGSDPSSILGNLTANGKVFLINPNGVLFGKGAQVNVGGLVASTLAITDGDLMAGKQVFAGTSKAAILNQGSITADGGHVALLGANVSNQGVILARLGSVALASGNAITLDVAGDGLLNVAINQGAVNALVENGGIIRADGGQVLLTALAAGGLLQGSVNNTGIIQAQTLANHAGTIRLLGDMQTGVTTVSGTLDASAPNGGNGGFIETSAATVNIADGSRVTTYAPAGKTGKWLIDPQDFTISASGNISGATLSNLLITNSVVISTMTGPDATVAGTPPVRSLFTAAPGNGDIFVNEAVSWTATPSTTTLTLLATRDVNINKAITATNGNLVVCCGRDINANAAVTTTNGSVSMSAGRDIFLNSALTTTDGNISMCAANNINIAGALTLTRGSTIPSQGLGLTPGLVLNAGNGGVGPGVLGGTVNFSPLAAPVTVTGPNAAAEIYYNPVSYSAPTNYLPNFTLTNGATLAQFMLVYPGGADKTFDGTTTASLTTLKGNPAGVALVPGIGSTAVFADPSVGIDKQITFTGYTLTGALANQYALPFSCCGVAGGKTSGTITAAIVTPVPVTPPPVTPTPVTPVPVTPPVVVPPTPPAAVIIPPAQALITVPALVPLPTPLPAIPTVPVINTAALPPELTNVLPPPAPVVVQPEVLPEAPVFVAPEYVPPKRPRKQDRH